MPRVTKASLTKEIKQQNPNCNPKHLSLMALPELKLAASGDLAAAVAAYEKRVKISKARTEKIMIKFDKKKFSKNLSAVVDEIEKGVLAIGRGNRDKGRRMLMNAKEIARRNNSASLKKIGKKITGYDEIIKTADGKPINYSLRFHLYPGLLAVKTMGGDSVLIQLSKKKSLIFTVNNETVLLERSIFLGTNKILDNTCVTVSGNLVNKNKKIHWEIKKNN